MAFTLANGQKSPDFKLSATDGKTYSLNNFSEAPWLAVFFTFNNCPYVIGSYEVNRTTTEKFRDKEIQFEGINANSKNTNADHRLLNMVKLMELQYFPWVYLHDETQEFALAYGALRTPHFYVFDKDGKLVYTGRGVDSPRDTSKMTENTLDLVLEALTKGQASPFAATNPIGCNVKWDGQDRHWMPADACDLV